MIPGPDDRIARFNDWNEETLILLRPRWNLDDNKFYVRVARLVLPWAWTYADTREGLRDKDKRAQIRERAVGVIPSDRTGFRRWGFRIWVRKGGRGRFDVENVSKLIVDAFSADRIRADESPHAGLALYTDDTVDEVVMLQIGGERTRDADETEVEIFALKESPPGSGAAAG